MKKQLLLIITLVVAICAKADIQGDGYYRVHNYDTDRYIYVYDNTGSLNMAGTTVDLNAIQLWSGLDHAISDPASVIYLEKHGNKYDFKTQGTGVYQMIGSYVNIRQDSKVPHTYWAYGEKSGMVKYLCDAISDPDEEKSWLVGEGTKRRNWYITPIDANSDNYFGITPTVKVKGQNYASLYADFPYTFASDGMEAYYVKSIDTKRGLAIWAKITDGNVATRTPAIIKCASADKSSNRLNLGSNNAAQIKDNMLVGVYFNFDDVSSHINRVAYDKNKMRVLGVTKDGNLGLVTSNIKYIDRNSFYLPVPANSPADFTLVTQEEYDYILENEVPDVTSVTLNKTTVEMLIGTTETLTATVLPDAAAKKLKVEWTSSNSKIAKVDDNGVVTAVAVGDVTITATCGGKKATCSVKVNPIVATAVTFNKTELSLLIGATETLKATVAPDNTTDKTVKWTTSDAKVATVDASGKVTAIAVGTATITAACGSVSAKCAVTVNPILATAVTLNKTEEEIDINATLTLVATVSPDNTTDKTVTWTSSDTEVATVDANGVVTGIAEGTVTITATCGEVSATCKVTVVDPNGGVNDIEADLVGPFDIYNLQGIKVKEAATDFEGLPAGIYVVNGGTYYVN